MLLRTPQNSCKMWITNAQINSLGFTTFFVAVFCLFTSISGVTTVKQLANNVNTRSDTNTTSQNTLDSGNKTENIAEKHESENKISKILVALSNGTEESASLRVAIRSSEDSYEELISSKGEAFESMDANGDTACFFSHVYGANSRMVLRCYASGKQVLEYDTRCTDHAYHPHVHIDPFAQNVYWRHGETGHVWLTSLKTNVSVLVHSDTRLWKPNSLFAVDPFEGLIFWSSNTSEAYCGIGIQKLGTSESDSLTLLRGKDLQNETLCANVELTLDVEEKMVYWLTPNYLSVGKYYGNVVSQFKIPTFGKRIYQGTGLKYFEDELFWVEPSFSIFIHSFHLRSNQTKPEIQNMNCSITEYYLNATFLLYGKPPRNLSNPCEYLTCSHICIMKSKNAANCYCPFGMKLIGSNHCSPTSFGLISTDGDHGVIVVTKTTPNSVAGPYNLSPTFDLTSNASTMNSNLARICYVPKEDCGCFQCQEINSNKGSETPKIYNITKDQTVKALVVDETYSSVFSISRGKEASGKWCVGQTRFNVNENETWSELFCDHESLQVSAIDPREGMVYYFDKVSSTIKVINLFNVTDEQESIQNVTNVAQMFFETNSDEQKFIVGLEKSNTKFWVHHLDEGKDRDFHYIKPTHPVQFAYQNNRLYWSEKPLENSNAAWLLKSYSLLTKAMEEIKFPNPTTFRRFFLSRLPAPSNDFHFPPSPLPPTPRGYLYLGLIVLVVALVSSILTYGGSKYYRHRRDRQFYGIANNFLYVSPEGIDESWPESRKARNAPFTKILTNRLKTDKSRVIGKGTTTVVYKGEMGIGSNIVAVKTILPATDSAALEDLLRELKMTQFAGDHESLLRFLCADVSNIRGGEVYAVFENATLGNLKNYLERMPESAFDPEDGANKEWKAVVRRSNSDSCMSWIQQIANGMAYLAGKNIVHGDLRAKNIYVFPGNVVKIANFGLPGIIYRYANGEAVDTTLLPWQWMSIQALQYQEFTEASDVWAYAVTLWEIFSMGVDPYKGKMWNEQFIKDLRNGIKLNKPALAPVKLYEKLMVLCWKFTPPQRPTFDDIVNDLKTLG